MAELPSGAVTFLFTDVEGSTRLVKQLRQRYAAVLADHQRLLRDAFENHEGHEVDTQGDSFFVAFASARDAVGAAVEGQRAILTHRWPEGVQVKVRMGIHTGQAVVSDGRYTGLAVHRAARIGAAGHGGQILVSQATQTLLEDEEEDVHVFLRDLGEQRLKDLDRPVRLFQVTADGLPSEFPPLRHEAQLAQAAEAALAASRFPRLRLALLATALALAAVAVVSVLVLTHGGAPISVRPNSVAVIDPKRNKVIDQIPVGTRPSRIVYGHGALWVVNQGDKTISRVDPVARRQVRPIPLLAVPTGLAVGKEGIWVTTDKGIKLVDPAFDDVTRTITIRESAPTITGPFVTSPTGIAFTNAAAWVINGDFGGHVLRVDIETGRVVDEITTGNTPAAVAGSGGGLWVADSFDNTVTRIDRTGAVTAKIGVGHAPNSIAVGGGAVWVADGPDNNVKRIDPTIPAVETTIPVGVFPSAIAVGNGAVWVANRDEGTVSRIDPHRDKVVRTIKIGGSPVGLAFARGSLWVSVQPRPPAVNPELVKQGGLGQVDWGPFSIDPATQETYDALSFQLEYATCAKLLNYPDKAAPAGSRLQPDVAQSMPTVSGDGKTYTFTIRSGFRFSPPSNQPVTAATFKYTIERTLNPKLKSPARQFVTDIVGEKAYAKGKAAHIVGVIAGGKTLSIKLTHAAGDFPARIAMPFFCAVPRNTPMHPIEAPPIPMAGPYYIASYVPGTQTVLKRNPNYIGPRPRRLAEIVYTSGLSTPSTIAEVVAGQTDYAPDIFDSASRTKLNPRYGANSPAAHRGHQQVFIHRGLGVDALALNTSRGLFANARLRRAVNYAIDRRALARQGGFGNAGPLTTVPTDQYLAPGVPGFRDVDFYPLSGDLRRARELAGNRRRTAVMYTCDFAPCPQEAQIVRRNLAAIGIAVEIKTFKIVDLFARQGRRNEPYDIGLMTWREDYPDPFDFLNINFDGTLVLNSAHFDEPAWNRRLEAAARLSGERRYRAYAHLEADLVRQTAPWVAFQNLTNFDFFSARIGCQTYQPFYGMDLAALCVRPEK